MTVKTPASPSGMPAGACDCHTHVFGPPARYPYATPRHYTPGEAGVRDLAALHARLGIERVVIVQPSPYGTDNRCTLDATRAFNAGGADAARAVVVIDDAATPQDLHDMHAAGARGMRINLQTHGMNDTRVARAMLQDAGRRVAGLGWHVQMFTNLDVVAALADTLDRMPVPVVLDHYAGARAAAGLDQPGLRALLDLLAGGNVYLKLSAPQRISSEPDCADAGPLTQALARHRADRMLWGTDWPHPGAWPGVRRDPSAIEPFHPVDDARALARLRQWVPDPATQRAILADNPARLYGW